MSEAKKSTKDTFINTLKTHPLMTITLAAILLLVTFLVIVRISAITDRAIASTDGLEVSKALSVTTVTVNAVDEYQTKQKISGQVIASRESDHGFDRSGILAEVLVDEGDRVKKGDVLAKLDMRALDAQALELDADMASANAMVKEAQATLNRVTNDFDRFKALRENGHISQARFDQINNELESAKARLITAKSTENKVVAAIEKLKVDRDMSTLRARFDGSVIARYADEGSSFGMSGGPMVRLIEDGKLEIRVGLSETAAASLKPGSNYTFTQSGENIDTTLRSLIGKVDQNTRTVTAIFDVIDTDFIRPGSLAELSINVNVTEKGYWLPTEALAESRRGLWTAFTLNPIEGYRNVAKLSREELQVIYTEADRVFVRGTLQNGDKVVSSGTHRLSDGFIVKTDQER